MRKPWWAVLPALAVFAVLVSLAVQRSPRFLAESQVLVGSSVPATAAEEQADANVSLAAVYSRMVGTGVHTDVVERWIGRAVDGDRFTAAPIPETPFVRIEADAPSQAEAVALARAGADALVALVDERAAARETERADVLTEHVAAAAALVDAELERDRISDLLAELSDDESTPLAEIRRFRDELVAAEAEVRSRQLQVDAIESGYVDDPQDEPTVVALERFGAAQPMGSDRLEVLQRNGIIGVLVGGLLGAALATLAANGWRLVPTDPRGTTAPPDGRPGGAAGEAPPEHPTTNGRAVVRPVVERPVRVPE